MTRQRLSRRAVHESLERRVHLSGLVWFDNGTLLVIGSDSADCFEIIVEPAAHVLGPGSMVSIYGETSGQLLLPPGFFPMQDLQAIAVFCRGGDDLVRLSIQHPNLSTVVFGEAGDDVVQVAFVGERVNCSIFGGDGNDILWAQAQADSDLGFFITGDGGDDLIVGSGLSDVIYGDSDSSSQHLAGNDTIYGGDGKDELWGWPGDDVLWGEGGGDMLVGGSGRDTLLGGAGHDLAFVDDEDKYDEVGELTVGSI
jgi:Ca2+-binding RTX toxin-like protein